MPYEEGKDEKAEMEAEDEELKHRLPPVAEGERLKLHKLLPEQHFTEPPPRYNEAATLVKTLEEKEGYRTALDVRHHTFCHSEP